MTAARMASVVLVALLCACGDPPVAQNVDGPIKSVDAAAHKLVLDDGTKAGAVVQMPATAEMEPFKVGARARLEQPQTPGGDVKITVYPAPVKVATTVVAIDTASRTVTLSDGTKMPVKGATDFAFMRIGLPITVDLTPPPFTTVVRKGTAK